PSATGGAGSIADIEMLRARGAWRSALRCSPPPPRIGQLVLARRSFLGCHVVPATSPQQADSGAPTAPHWSVTCAPGQKQQQQHEQLQHEQLQHEQREVPPSTAAQQAAEMHPPGVGAEGEGEELLSESHQALNDFLVWLVANDVQGIGFDDSPVALYEECGRPGDASSPERGLMAQRDIAAGEVVLRVPLRLALTDHAADRESNRLVYEDAPWSVRLATKLLREVGKGRTSPWFPYLRVLPSRLPVPLETFGWEDMQQLEWAPAQAAIYEYNWLVTEAYNRAAGSRSPSPSLLASTPAAPTPLAAASPSPSGPHTLPDSLNATPPSPSPSPSPSSSPPAAASPSFAAASPPPAAASPPPARSASPDPAWGLGPGLATSLAPGPRSPSPGPFPWPSAPKIDLGGVGQDTGQQGGAVVEPQGGAWGGEGEGQWGVSGVEGGVWRDRGVGPGPVVDWTVRERQRVGSPAPTTDQIRQVLGGASPEEFQWAMAVSVGE
ncbi:hypothetical protein QJQ45_017424, partial [Haematococcus lacustris]